MKLDVDKKLISLNVGEISDDDLASFRSAVNECEAYLSFLLPYRLIS